MFNMMLSKTSETEMLAIVRRLRRLLRKADLVTKRVRVTGASWKTFYIGDCGGQRAEVRLQKSGHGVLRRLRRVLEAKQPQRAQRAQRNTEES
jgi:alpha-D-ribose 1-methylphosphonate 5-triphosphate synthase subunit PhnG